MPYLSVNDFKFGMDRRRKQSVGIPGTLWIMKNAVMSRGGDVERAKKFVKTHTLPAGTFGLGVVNNQLFVFGSTTEPVGMPNDITYQKLLSGVPGGGSGATYDMTGVIDAQAFDGKAYVIASYNDGGLNHFYNGSKVSQWATVAGDGDSTRTVAIRLAKMVNSSGVVRAQAIGSQILIKAVTPGVTFSWDTDVDENSDVPGAYAPTFAKFNVRSNVSEVDEVRASGSLTITGGVDGAIINTVTIDGVDLLNGNPVAWFSTDDETANAVVLEINKHTGTHGYLASELANVVTMTAAAGTGAGPNGDVVSSTKTGTITLTPSNVAGGVAYVAPVSRIVRGAVAATSYNGACAWGVEINSTWYWTTGLGSNTGDSIFIQKNRIWTTVRSLLRYCKLNDPTDWTDTNASSGAGFINIGNQAEGAQELYCVEEFNGKAAIFAEGAVVIYALAADAQNITISQTLKNTGTTSPKSALAYGADDVFYLDKTGIRSLRSRVGYDAAFASDIGSAIDPFVKTLLTGENRADAYSAKSAVETEDGRFFMSVGTKVIVLSYFPASKITAWSYIDFGLPIDNLVRCGDTIVIRSGDDLYTYGGEDGTTYPDAGEFEVLVETPFMAASDPASKKQMQSFDHAAEGEWFVELLPDPNDTTKTIAIGRLTGTTYNDFASWMPGYTTAFALRYTCDTAGFTSLSALANHFEKGENQ